MIKLLCALVWLGAAVSIPNIVLAQSPFKLPFSVKLSADGRLSTHSWRVPTHGHGGDGYESKDGSVSTEIVVDSGRSFTDYITGDTVSFTETYSFIGDSLRYRATNVAIGPSPRNDTAEALLVFNSVKDSVLFLSLHTGGRDNSYGIIESSSFTFSALNFVVTDTSLTSNDSTLQGHGAVFEYWYSSAEYEVPGSQIYGWFSTTDLVKRSVDLSGLFRPIHLTEPARSIPQDQPLQALRVTQHKDVLGVSFPRQERACRVQVFSLVGGMVASQSVDPGQTQCVMQGLSGGCYIVRLGKLVSKIVLAE